VPTSAALQGIEFVAHLFVATDGLEREADRGYLLELWQRCRDEFGIGDEFQGFPGDPDLDGPPAAGGVLAVRRSAGTGKHQAVLRQSHDAFCLAVLRSPGPGEPAGWPELDTEWTAVLGQPTSGVIGSVRILQARLADPAAVLDAGALGPVAESAAGESVAEPRNGVVVSAAPLGPFAVWEASDQPPAAQSWDGRAHRRVVVVAPAARDPELSAWTWSRSDAEPTPFAHYLLHAAKARYELRIWPAGLGGRELRQQTDTAMRPLLDMVDEIAQTGRDPDVGDLVAASVPLARLQAGELGLVDRASRLREVRRSVVIAARNMALYAGADQSLGLFAEDKALVEWLDRQLDHDATYLEAALDRARSVTALTDQLVQRGLQRRQERFNLGLTAVIGAILMVLAAVQSLQYEVPIPKPVQPAVVTALGAFALLLSLVVLRAAVPGRRRWPAAAVCAGTALFGATLGWIAATVLAGGAGAAVCVARVSGVVGAVTGLAVAALVTRPWQRSA
jgi:CASPASE and TPR Repeat-Associated N-terminal domain/CASPASE and TPR Repeat-Associated C-terminal domain